MRLVAVPEARSRQGPDPADIDLSHPCAQLASRPSQALSPDRENTGA
jgi:hypothetical protein